MTTNIPSESSAPLSPDEAFAVLGEEVRLQILQTLGEADGPLSYSGLFERVEYDDPSNFNYHLDKLTGHFVRSTDQGYDLWRPGRRVVEAILSGAVTENPVFEPTRIDSHCPYCSAPIEVGFQQERVEMYCTNCPGIVADAESGGRYFTEQGSLGHMSLPPAGVYGRTPTDVLEAAWTWKHLDVLSDSTGVCSGCSASIDHAVTVCENHDVTEGSCEQCGRRYAVRFDISCPNCHYDINGIAPTCLLATTELLEFLTSHGINPVAPGSMDRVIKAIAQYDEEVISTDPFEARFTFTVDSDAIVLTVDDDLAVVDATTHESSDNS